MKEALEELKDLMGDSFSLLLDVFIRDTQVRLEGIGRCIEEGNFEEVKKIAHAIKGSSRNMGAEELAVLCEKCEAIPVLDDAASLSGLYEEACNVFDNICSEMRLMLNEE